MADWLHFVAVFGKEVLACSGLPLPLLHFLVRLLDYLASLRPALSISDVDIQQRRTRARLLAAVCSCS
jgi:hypothetical protein